jgi:hypothetical protein
MSCGGSAPPLLTIKSPVTVSGGDTMVRPVVLMMSAAAVLIAVADTQMPNALASANPAATLINL